MKSINKIIWVMAITGISLACTPEDEVEPYGVNFTNTEVGISTSTPTVEIGITFSRAAPSAGEISLGVNSGNLIYGESADFYSIPALVAEEIIVPFEAGAESVSFNINAGSALNIQQDETVTLMLNQSSDEFTIGINMQLSITFSENFIALEGIMELNAGGEDFGQVAFADLSKIIQTNIDKYTWDLGFSTDASYKIVLNNTASVMARSIDKFDMISVTAEDTAGFSAQMIIPQFDPSVGAIEWVDSPDGDLAKTAFDEVSATASENPVYIIKRDGEGRNWKKVRIMRDGDNYTVQYADINSETFSTATIGKDADFNFNFMDLDNGEVAVEPAKDSWDIMYGTYTESLNLGAPGMDIPYGFKDFIIINRNEISTAMVMVADIAYDDFAAGAIANLEFSSLLNSIGSSWRSGGGPTSGPALKDDRYYIIVDTQSNVYKLKFNRLTSLDGERGKPEFSYQLVQ